MNRVKFKLCVCVCVNTERNRHMLKKFHLNGNATTSDSLSGKTCCLLLVRKFKTGIIQNNIRNLNFHNQKKCLLDLLIYVPPEWR